MFGAIDISTSGLVAQRIRSNTIAMNIAMADAVTSPEGGPYKRRSVIFSVGSRPNAPAETGVHVSAIEKQEVYRLKYDPKHPYANQDGNVKLPGIEPLVEMANLMEATRAYEANLTAVEVSKAMLNSSLRLLA